MRKFTLIKQLLIQAILCSFLLGLSSIIKAQSYVAFGGTQDAGNQGDFSDRLGSNFTVNSPIVVSHLGVFDDGQDGISSAIDVGIVRVSDGATVTGPISISGNSDPLEAKFRFRSITPVTLAAGDYIIVAVGFNQANKNGNNTIGGYTPTVTNDGGGLITSTGSSFGGGGFGVPTSTIADKNIFHAGSFKYSSPGSPGGGNNGQKCFASSTKPDVVNAKSVWTYNATDQTITIRTSLSKTFVDNTYGTNAVGWPSGHKFTDLVGSDQLQLALYDAAGVKKLEFKMDYLSASSAAPSGYKSLGVSGGDGKLLVGSASNITNVVTSLDQNFNAFGYKLITNSPATNASYTPDPSYPNWIYDVWYEVTVKASAFGSAGFSSFGYPSITGLHASPSKTGNNSEIVTEVPCTPPPPPPPGSGGAQCFASPTIPATVNAKSVWTINSNGTVTIRTTFSKTFVDNTYGTNAIGWPSGHKFNDLVGSDNLELALFDAAGNKKMDFKIDYISSSSTATSGYKSLGVTGGDGKMVLGNASDVVDAMTSLDQNFNLFGYVLTSNSPQTNAAYAPNSAYPKWVYDVWYEVTVKQSAFGSNGFGYPDIASVHASPSKTKNNSEIVKPVPCPCNIKVTGTVVNATCNGSATGSIDITVTGNDGTVTYKWSDGSTTEDRTNLKAGDYSVVVTDGSTPNCTATKTFTITEFPALNVTSVIGNVTTVGGSNGSIDITVSGGTPPYTYKWNDGPTTEDRTGLKAGTYTVTVTDQKNCAVTKSFDITEPPCSLIVNGTKSDVLCFGNTNGSITITSVTGNTGTVTFKWSDGPTTQNRTGLGMGTYTVTVTDPVTLCQVTKSFTINQPTELKFSAKVTNVTNGNDGAIDITVTGGTLPYTYAWSDGVTKEDRTGLAAGSYTVMITDANGCMISYCIIVRTCTLTVTYTSTNLTCYGVKTGSIDVTVMGAQGAVAYKWNDGPTTEDRSKLGAGTYTLVVTDAIGCKVTIVVKITQPPALVVTGVTTKTCGCGASDGTITLTVSGGTPPYSYLWSDGSTDKNRTGLAAGTYSVTVTDANNCTTNASFEVTKSILYNRPANSSGKTFVSAFSASVSPNPTTGKAILTMHSPVNGVVTTTITDAVGRTLSTVKYGLSQGINMREIDLSNKTHGIYYIQVVTGETRKTLKVIVGK